MYRSPTSPLVFESKFLYRRHLSEIMWANELPWKEFRRLKQQYQAGRAELWNLHTFRDVKDWIDNNRELILRAPCLGVNARGNREGKVTAYKEMVIEGTKYMQNINSEVFNFLDDTYNQFIENRSGWMFRGYFEPKRGQDPRFSITDTCRALTAYGFYIVDYIHENRKDGNSVYSFQAFILARDFSKLAMMEKLAGRVSGKMNFLAT